MKKIWLKFLALSIAVSACTQGSYFRDNFSGRSLSFVEPVQDWRDRQGNCLDGFTCWSELTQSTVRRRLGIIDGDSRLYKKETDGSLSFAGGSAMVGRGEYVLEKYIVAYTNLEVVDQDGTSSLRRVGVGVRILADITSKSRSIDLGDLFPLALAASNNEVRGRIRIRSWGINSSNRTLNSLISSANVALDEDGVQSAISALQIGEAMLDDEDTILLPYTFAVEVPNDG